jgi:uncharacterized membrane protein YqjE
MCPDSNDKNHGPDDERGTLSRLLHALTSLIVTLLATLQTHLELLRVDIQYSIRLAASLLLWSLAALLTTIVALIFAGATLIIIFWDTHRVLVAVLVTLSFFGFSAVAVLLVAARLRGMPSLFEVTLNELQRDQDELQNACELQRADLASHWQTISRQAQRTDRAIASSRRTWRWIVMSAPWVARWLFKRR